MRDITHIIIHCSATPAGREVTAAEVDQWHRARGFDGIGYHRFIRLDGTVEFGRPLVLPGAHARPMNRNSIGVCYAGGLSASGEPADTRTAAQRLAMAVLVHELVDRFPGVQVIGHRDVPGTNKACPSFDAGAWWADEQRRHWKYAA